MSNLMRLAMATLAAGALLGGATQAIGAEEGGVTARGMCSESTFWQLTIAPEVGLEMEVKIESGVVDDPWRVRLAYNGHLMLDVLEFTEEPDGAFEIFKVENNAQGEDNVTLKARNTDTGEICWGGVEAEL
jgi:hypothetical protein